MQVVYDTYVPGCMSAVSGGRCAGRISTAPAVAHNAWQCVQWARRQRSHMLNIRNAGACCSCPAAGSLIVHTVEGSYSNGVYI